MKRSQIIALAAVVVFLIAVPVYWALTPPMSGGILNTVTVTPEPAAYMGYWCSGPPAPPAAHKPRFQSGSDHPCSQREVEVTFERAGGTPVP